jgi:hypothetical protein
MNRRMSARPVLFSAVCCFIALFYSCSDDSVEPHNGPPAASGWFAQSPLPTGEALADVCAADA